MTWGVKVVAVNRLWAYETMTRTDAKQDVRAQNFQRNVVKLLDKFIEETGKPVNAFAAKADTTNTTINRWLKAGIDSDRGGVVERFCAALNIETPSMWEKNIRYRSPASTDESTLARQKVQEFLDSKPTSEKLSLLMTFVSTLRKA